MKVGRVFVGGKGVGDVSRIVLRDRRHLAGEAEQGLGAIRRDLA